MHQYRRFCCRFCEVLTEQVVIVLKKIGIVCFVIERYLAFLLTSFLVQPHSIFFSNVLLPKRVCSEYTR